MSRYIDTHCHLYHGRFDPDRAEAVARARQVCQAVLLPNIDLASLEPMQRLVTDNPDLCFAMAGMHPCDVPEDLSPVLDRIESELATGRYVGVGETGLDLYWDASTLARQQHSLRRHLQWGRELGLPVVLHSRNAFRETLALVEELQDGRLTGVFHCFSDGHEEALRALDAGFYLGLGGVLTYKDSTLPEAIRSLPFEYLLLETDSPFLPPVPYRGKRNEPAYIAHVADKLAQIREMTPEEVGLQTSENARRLFTRLPRPPLAPDGPTS